MYSGGTQAALNCTGAQAGSYPTFPSPFPAPTNFPYIPPFNQIAVSYDPSGEYKVPTVYEWNLTLEHQLPYSLLMRMAYVGSRSMHILETQDFNAAPCCTTTGKAGIGIANSLVKAASGGKFGTNTFSTVQADITDINANYNSLQTSLEKRMSHGLTILANYTWSKSLDDLPFGEGVSGFDTGYSPLPLSDPNRHRFDYGPSSFDHTHVFSGVLRLANSQPEGVRERSFTICWATTNSAAIVMAAADGRSRFCREPKSPAPALDRIARPSSPASILTVKAPARV